MRRVLGLGAVAVGLALAAVGCGGDDGGGASDATEAATWAAGFCQALETLGEDLSEAGSGLAGDGLPTVEEVREAVDSAAAAIGAFGDTVDELGAPDVPSGEEITSRLESAADEAGRAFEEIEGDIDGPFDDAGDVAVAAGAIAQATQKALTAIGEATTSLEELDTDGSLRTELEDVAECANVSS